MNLNSIDMHCLYRHEPDIKYSGHKDNLFWCQNWTFKPFECNGKIYMRDTYWSSGDGMTIEVTEDNIDEFEVVFNWNDVDEAESYKNIEEFGEQGKDWFIVSVDSGGMYHPRIFIRKGAKRNKDMVISRKLNEIKRLKREIVDIEDYIERLKTGEIEPRNWE